MLLFYCRNWQAASKIYIESRGKWNSQNQIDNRTKLKDSHYLTQVYWRGSQGIIGGGKTEDAKYLVHVWLIHFIFSLCCCSGWGYIVRFTKVLTMYQIYHTWIHPLHNATFWWIHFKQRWDTNQWRKDRLPNKQS
jgi:hypothetical protein